RHQAVQPLALKGEEATQKGWSPGPARRLVHQDEAQVETAAEGAQGRQQAPRLVEGVGFGGVTGEVVPGGEVFAQPPLVVQDGDLVGAVPHSSLRTSAWAVRVGRRWHTAHAPGRWACS